LIFKTKMALSTEIGLLYLLLLLINRTIRR
jgi:hypothetical protein